MPSWHRRHTLRLWRRCGCQCRSTPKPFFAEPLAKHTHNALDTTLDYAVRDYTDQSSMELRGQVYNGFRAEASLMYIIREITGVTGGRSGCRTRTYVPDDVPFASCLRLPGTLPAMAERFYLVLLWYRLKSVIDSQTAQSNASDHRHAQKSELMGMCTRFLGISP